jgi:hypothetical protein
MKQRPNGRAICTMTRHGRWNGKGSTGETEHTFSSLSGLLFEPYVFPFPSMRGWSESGHSKWSQKDIGQKQTQRATGWAKEWQIYSLLLSLPLVGKWVGCIQLWLLIFVSLPRDTFGMDAVCMSKSINDHSQGSNTNWVLFPEKILGGSAPQVQGTLHFLTQA